MEMSCRNQKQLLEVQVIEEKVVRPSFPTPNHLQSYQLSFFDQLAPDQDMPLLYLYPVEHQPTIKIDEVEIARTHEKLQLSLSNTLTHFYPIAGRFANDGLSSVGCQDQGVIYVEAKVNCKLTQFQDELHRDVRLLGQFFAQNTGDAIGRVQVTFFECGGFALTGLISHIIADGFIGCTFIYEWAKMSKFGTSEFKCFSFNGASIFPPQDSSRIQMPAVSVEIFKPADEIVTKKYIFDKVAIENLKDQVKANDPTLFFPSKVEVVLSFIWRGLIRAARTRHGRLRASLTSLAVSLRGKTALVLDNNIPGNTFGNLVVGVPLKFMPDETKMEFHHFVHLIRRTLQKETIKFAKSSSDEIFLMALSYRNEFLKMLGEDNVDVWISTSLCRFPLYETDFGWGKPSWILHDQGKESFEMFKLSDTKCGTGVEVLLHLNGVEMAIFENDQEITAITSTTH